VMEFLLNGHSPDFPHGQTKWRSKIERTKTAASLEILSQRTAPQGWQPAAQKRRCYWIVNVSEYPQILRNML
jgi:hypothetical protein